MRRRPPPKAACGSSPTWGLPYNLASIEIWNFQWNLNGDTDLSNRGVSQFDILVRNTEADTEDGTAGSTAINLDNPSDNLIDNDAVFDLGSSNPWQVALADQALDRAPNNDTYAGQRFDLSGNVARFVALRVNSYHGGNGIGLGKVRFTAVSPRPLRIAAHYDGSDLVFTWESEAGNALQPARLHEFAHCRRPVGALPGRRHGHHEPCRGPVGHQHAYRPSPGPGAPLLLRPRAVLRPTRPSCRRHLALQCTAVWRKTLIFLRMRA